LSAQQAGIAAPQSALVAHARQRPSTQRGSVAGQSESALHSTHPSVLLHSWPIPHVFAPFTPHSALPEPGPELLLPHPRIARPVVRTMPSESCKLVMLRS
jgi:hypothetical protein